MSDDRELVDRVRAGEPGAWEELVVRYGRLLWSVPLRLGLREADAEEVFQNTWITLHRHLQLIRDPGRLSAWLVRTATRESWRVARRRPASSEAALTAADPPAALDADPSVQLEDLEFRDALEQAIAETREPCADLLELLFLAPERRSYAEIADELGVPVGSLGPTRRRCLAELARRLEERGFA